MNFNRKFFTLSLLPLAFCCCTINTSCSKEICIDSKFKDDPISEGWDDPVLDMPLSEFKKTFTFGDIIRLEINAKDGKNYTIDLPYIKEFTEAGYYAPCIADYVFDKDGQLSVDISLALWPSGHSVTTDKFFGQPVKVKMKEKGGYLYEMNQANCAHKLTYEECGSSPSCFANFRDVTEVGNIGNFIKKGKLFRGSAPFMADDTNRYEHVNYLMKTNNITYDICLSKAEKKFDKKKQMDVYPFSEAIFDKSPNADYIRTLYGTKGQLSDKVTACNFGTDYFTSYATSMVCEVLEALGSDDMDANYYIHCNEGKDRTGFFIMLLEAFAPTNKKGEITIDDIIADFMLSYKNYYNVTLAEDINRYQALVKLTIYRHIYSIMLPTPEENPGKSVGAVDWYDKNFDVRKAVNEKLNEKSLHDYALDYINTVLRTKHDQSKTDKIISNIQSKFYYKDTYSQNINQGVVYEN